MVELRALTKLSTESDKILPLRFQQESMRRRAEPRLDHLGLN